MSKCWMLFIISIYLPHLLAAPAEKPKEGPPTDIIPLELQVPEDTVTSSTSTPSYPEPSSPEVTPPSVPPCQNTTDVYDSSQNGTDNVRVNVKGFTIFVAPSDTLLGAAMIMHGMDENKPVPEPGTNDVKENNVPSLRTINDFSKLLHMLKKFNGNDKSLTPTMDSP